jgi:hypothetical protein
VGFCRVVILPLCDIAIVLFLRDVVILFAIYVFYALTIFIKCAILCVNSLNMKEGQRLGEQRYSLSRRITPGREAFVFGCGIVSEGALVAGAYHNLTREQPVGASIEMLGASLIAVAMMHRVSRLVKQRNAIEDQLSKYAQAAKEVPERR